MLYEEERGGGDSERFRINGDGDREEARRSGGV